MARVELDPGKDSFTGSWCGSIGERGGSIVGSSKGGGLVEGTGGIGIDRVHHLVSQQGDHCQGKSDQPERISWPWMPRH